MPIYEYECQKCKTHVEAFQKISDKPLVKCRKCGGRLEKMVSAPAIQFKGSGWYVTDYSGKGKQAAEKVESEGTSEDKSPDKKPDKKTKDSSPASKTSAKSSSPKIPSSD
jgi:putative FmdB family regulatory protein